MIDEAARIFAQARRANTRIEALPASAKPTNLAEAHAIQEATAHELGEPDRRLESLHRPGRRGHARRHLRLAHARQPRHASRRNSSRCSASRRRSPSASTATSPPATPLTREPEIAAAVTALVAIEIVNSRFLSYKDAPFLDRTADCMSNGAFVAGTVRPDWRDIDLSQLEATLRVNGAVIVQKRGGHVAGNPIRPAIPLVNALHGISAGQIITTGTFTGLVFVKPGDHVVAEFTGFGAAEIRFAGDV